MLPHPRGQVVPTLELRHQPPKTIRPSSSPRRLAASGSCSLRKRSARAKNCCCFRFSASMPFSISSNNMRFLLSFRLLARLPTCFASLGGRLTLWRTAFSTIFITSLCTKMVCGLSTPIVGRFQPSDVNLLHLKHRFHHSPGARRVLIGQHFDQRLRHDLPRHPVFIHQPAALDFLAAGRELFPIVVHLLPLFAVHDERDCGRELVVRPAVQ